MTPDRHAHAGADLAGRVLDGRYRMGARIARGGMASVYEALDLRLDRVVAVKVMHPGLGDDREFAARFVSEARAAARLSHPNVVSVFDQGDDDGTVFLAMELVPGHTLREVIGADAPLSPARALALLEPVVSALAAAHRAGLIHRDVKPENVLIADDGRVKVADFGLAKAVSATTQHTATGVLIGTVSYVAPELVVEGRSDARADVYAAGVILYELLTGHKPHSGETPIQVAYKHVHQDVPPPSRAVSGVPDYLDALVARATARDREQRPADAGVLLHHLRRVNTAVTAGVRADRELVDDLRPRTPVGGQAGAVRRETTPEPWHHAEVAALLAPPRETTATLERPVTRAPVVVPPEPAPPPARSERRTPAGPPPRTPKAGRPRRRRFGPVLLVLCLLAAGGIGASAWWFGYARYTPMPGVIGLTQADAQERLDAAGLDVSFTTKTTDGDPAYSSTVAKGRVIGTDPPAGDRVLDGREVTAVVSLGREVYTLPKLTDITEDEAQDRIREKAMAFGSTTKSWSETVPEGIVISSDPASGATLRPGTIVDLVVSRGRHPIPVGSWLGRSADDARDELEGRGLAVESTEVHDDVVAEGDVVAQTPDDGTLFKGDTVTLTVSLGPELVEVPDVVAYGIDDATATLEAAGFEVETQNAIGYLGLGYVFSQDPGGGESLPKGSTVILTLI